MRSPCGARCRRVLDGDDSGRGDGCDRGRQPANWVRSSLHLGVLAMKSAGASTSIKMTCQRPRNGTMNGLRFPVCRASNGPGASVSCNEIALSLTVLLQAVRNDLVPHAHVYVPIDDGRRHPPNRGTQTGAGIKHPTYIRCVICMKSTGCRIESPNDAIRIVI